VLEFVGETRTAEKDGGREGVVVAVTEGYAQLKHPDRRERVGINVKLSRVGYFHDEKIIPLFLFLSIVHVHLNAFEFA